MASRKNRRQAARQRKQNPRAIAREIARQDGRKPRKRCQFTGKEKFGDKAEAEAAIAEAARLKAAGVHRGKVPVRAYGCPDCGAMHLTSLKTPPAKR